MKLLLILLILATVIILLSLLIAYICFYMAFYVPRRKAPTDAIIIPEGHIYEPFRDQMVNWIKEARALDHEDVSITSFDGLKLTGKFFEYAPGAPIELMFHGYRGSAERDLSGGVQRCFALGRSILLVDQRTSGGSEGHVISFGINESRDCLSWIDFILDHYGQDSKIILTGISMGAATVMNAAGKDLPDNVIGVLADCGYSTAEAIIKKAIREMHLPPTLMYPFVKLGAKIFGHFDLEETSPLEAMKTCKLPIIFVHGEDDDFVPCDMSREVYAACSSPKLLFTVPGAGHGLGYIVDLDGYLESVVAFSNKYITPTEVVKYPM